MASAAAEVERTFRLEFGRVVATLVRLLGEVDVAEEAVQEAFLVAVQRWPQEGVPPNPGGWTSCIASDGSLVLPDQDRSRWDRCLIAEGHGLVASCLRRNRPGPHQLQAAINAVHTDAPTAAATDWAQILALYDQLLALSPTPAVALNRAVALAEVRGPAAALAAVDAVDLRGYDLVHATRADLLRRLGRHGEAAAAYDAALELVANATERRFLEQRRRSLPGR